MECWRRASFETLGKKSMDWRYNTIWFDQLDQDRIAKVDLRAGPLPSLQGKQYVSFRGYRQENGFLDALPPSGDVLFLELAFSGLRAFDGIGRLPSLKRLELVHCYKLESDSGLEEIAASLRYLHICNSKRLHAAAEIRSLREIEVLRLNSCGEIDSLDFLFEFPRLIDFRFVNTSVRNGDLSPLIAHKSLRSVGFMDKRHYSMTAAEVDRALEAKSAQPFQEFVSKGQWRTFRFLSGDQRID